MEIEVVLSVNFLQFPFFSTALVFKDAHEEALSSLWYSTFSPFSQCPFHLRSEALFRFPGAWYPDELHWSSGIMTLVTKAVSFILWRRNSVFPFSVVCSFLCCYLNCFSLKCQDPHSGGFTVDCVGQACTRACLLSSHASEIEDLCLWDPTHLCSNELKLYIQVNWKLTHGHFLVLLSEINMNHQVVRTIAFINIRANDKERFGRLFWISSVLLALFVASTNFATKNTIPK